MNTWMSSFSYGTMRKRKRKELTLREKVEVIAYKDKNSVITILEIAAKSQCCKTQIQSTLRDKQKLLDKFAVMGMEPARGLECADSRN